MTKPFWLAKGVWLKSLALVQFQWQRSFWLRTRVGAAGGLSRYTPLGAGVMPTYYEAMYAGAGPEEDEGMVIGGAGTGVPEAQTTPQSSETQQSAMGAGRGSGKGRGDDGQLGGSHRASNVESYDMWSEKRSGWSSSQDQNSEDRWSTGSQWERSSNENWSRHSDQAWRNYYVRDW